MKTRLIPTRHQLLCAIASLALFAGTAAQAAVVGDYTNRKVTEFFTYSDFGGGDVMFKVDLPIAGCEGGFWLRPSDAGFKANLATLLLAYTTKVNLRVWAYNDQLWTGSGAPTCRLYLLSPA
jgi:hypothetical protein